MVEQWPPAATDVRVVHVVDWPREIPPSFTFAEGATAGESVMRIEDDVRHQRHQALLTPVVDSLRQAGFAAAGYLVEGAVRQTIVALAANWPADVIVIGSHGRHGLDRALLGSVSEGVVRHAPCSVFVVRGDSRREADAQSSSATAVNREGVRT